MSFSEQTEKLTLDLIQAEYLNAVVNFGEKFNSLHEGYAVLLEEVEEVEEVFAKIKSNISYLWDLIKENSTDADKMLIIDKIEIHSINTIKELAQVGAVLMKIKNTLKGENA